MIYEGITVLLTAADQAAKYWIEKQDPKEFPRLLRPGSRIRLYRNHNEGFPFGFLKNYGELVRAVPLAVTSMLGGVFWYMLREKKGMQLHKLAAAMVLGGSISNLIDRYVRHYVVDYFSLEYGALKKVVFNLGDICVFAGAALFAVLEFAGEIKGAITKGENKDSGKPRAKEAQRLTEKQKYSKI